MALAASNSVSSDENADYTRTRSFSSLSSQSTYLNPHVFSSQRTITTHNLTPYFRRREYSSSLPALLNSQDGSSPTPVSKRKSSVWRPSLREQSLYFSAHTPSIAEEFVQENLETSSGPDSPASTVRSAKSEKSILLNVAEEDNHYKLFNVSGTLFVIDTTIFQDYPDTLLGQVCSVVFSVVPINETTLNAKS